MSFKFQALLVAVLAAGVLAAWTRSRRDAGPKAQRGRLRQPGWSLVLAALTVSFLASVTGMFERANMVFWLLAIAVGVAIVLTFKPSLAARIVPLALILLGLYGFVVIRSSALAIGGVSAYALLPVGNPGIEMDLVLPQAYALLFAGGWLAWRSPDPVLAGLRRGLGGRLAGVAPRDQLQALLLIPAGIVAIELLTSARGAIVALACLTLATAAAVAVVRYRPVTAGKLAAVGFLTLGVIGIAAAIAWNPGGSASFHWTGYSSMLDGAVVVSSQPTADVAAVQGLGLLALGAWLVPQAFPRVRPWLGMPSDGELLGRVKRLTESRAVAVDTASADLRRLERDLHDGAQARLVALGMSLRAAERLIPTSPDAAVALVAEARETSARALTELRELVRGVLPPVLADRGLADAVRALALDCPLSVQTDVHVPGRLPAPVETACYFAVAEVLTNAAKHSGARDARISMSHAGGLLRIEVTDFGLGGADPARGSGLAGVEKRLATFDGILVVSSPIGGPTMVVMEVPCALSSPRTSSC